MAHPIKELARLTTRSKQIDGTGFGGVVADNLEVAGALGMPDPNTGKKLAREPYQLARLVYCDDHSTRFLVKASLLAVIRTSDAGKITDATLGKMINAALWEFSHPATKINKNGEQELTTYSNRELAKRMGIDHKSLTERHETLYKHLIETINIWASDAIRHINLHLSEVAG